MLPFLKPKTVAGLIIAKRKPDGSKQELHSEGNEDQDLIAAAEDLIRALQAKDAKAVADAFKAAFDVCESQPHAEGEHLNDYDSQNMKAAREAEE